MDSAARPARLRTTGEAPMHDTITWPDLRGWHRPLLVVAAVTAPFVLVSLAGVLLDGRVLVGAPIWAKPFKFAVSIVIYALTWSWLIAYLPRHRLVRWAAAIIAAALLIEYVVIVGQVVRGRQSHFNVATPLDAVLWGVMGTSIAVLWLANLVVAVFLVRVRIGGRPLTWAVRAGTVISLFGIGMAFMMTRPTTAQSGSMRGGDFGGLIGAHSVGVVDGGPIMPVTGWSTTGGDLRITHFIGIHALQALPLVAVLLAHLARRLPVLGDEVVRTRLVLVASAGYAALTLLTLWQALRGLPLLSPDGVTLWTAAAIAGLTLAGTVTVIGAGRARRAAR
ncbi:hypothetical protein [Spongiactinospora sp. TRM90649]|uniref:hypothetical protein n=1 Tax=Spongiactinospora sp. TRM90649 TaxID=3031114 RepID=UPI0023F691FE|nr:hypothetical protein [Spongiactinospora sp. TRM90649]MDF5754283.1 hypothetical protein [Spongiactinospora sp. TRM90649]